MRFFTERRFTSASLALGNRATAARASVHGGRQNVADRIGASILGGESQNTSSDYQTLPP